MGGSAAYPEVMENFIGALGGLKDVLVFFVEHPPVVVVITLVVLAALGVRAARRARPIVTDDLRGFTAAMRQEAKRLAGGRCEHSTLGFRCRTPGGHADHIYPWSKGGLTTMSNCQSLCPRHNLQKSAQVPSRFYIKRLEARRVRYFPTEANRKVDWRTAA